MTASSRDGATTLNGLRFHFLDWGTEAQPPVPTAAAAAQATTEQKGNAGLSGLVTDQSGAVIPGATVTLTGSSGTKTSTANENGHYVVHGLPPGTYKLKVARVDAYINHYGWVRPPQYMQNKRKAMEVIHRGKDVAEAQFKQEKSDFDFGDLNLLTIFKGTHPAVMQERIRLFNWSDQLERQQNHLQEALKEGKPVRRHKHERMKYRILTFIEQHFLGGRQLFSFKNYRLK